MPNEQNKTEPPAETADNTQKKPECKGRSRAKRIFYGFILIFALIFTGFALILKSDFGGDFLDGKVQSVLQKKIGAFADINIENARLSLDDDYHIALEVRDIPVVPHADNITLSRLGRLRFGFATQPLLQRKIEPIQLEVDNAAVIIHKDENQQSIFASLPQDGQQRVAFDAVADLAFHSIEKLAEAADKVTINTFRFSNIDFTVKTPLDEQKFSVRQFRLRRLRQSMDIKAEILWLGQLITFNASAALNAQGQAQNFTASVNNLPFRLGADDKARPYLVNGRPNSGFFRLRAASDFSLSGVAEENGKKKLSAALNLRNAYSDISIEPHIPAKLNLAAAYEQGSGQIALHSSVIAIGGLEIPFSGMFGYAQAGADKNSADGKYNFALKAEDAVSSPADSPAESLDFDLDIGGSFSSLEKKTNLDNIALRTDEAVLLGNGSIRFGAEKWPEIIFILHTANMPVNEAKQLWPINISRVARHWVLSHIFGGDLVNMQMEIAIPEGFYQKDKVPPLLTGKELHISTGIENTRTDLIGTLPPLREAYGQLNVTGTNTNINLSKALAYVEDGRQLNVSDGQMSFIWHPGKPLWADLAIKLSGAIGPIGKLLACQPINAAAKVPFDMQKAKGELQAALKLRFPLYKGADSQEKTPAIDWNTDINFRDFTLGEPYRGTMQVANAAGRAQINSKAAQIDGDALLNAIPATLSIQYPLSGSAEKKEQIIFHFDDKLRNKLFPALDIFLKGSISADVGAEQGGKRPVTIDLSKAAVQIPWIGWKKGSGIPAKAEMSLPILEGGLKNIDIDDFVLNGPNFQIAGKIKIRDGNFIAADFDKFNLNRSDRLALSIAKVNKIYQVRLNGQSFDMRAFIKNLAENDQLGSAAKAGAGGIELTGAIDTVQGFYGENLRNFRAIYNRAVSGNDNILVSAVSKSQASLKIQANKQRGLQQIAIITDDAGAFLRFMNYYDKVQGGHLESNLQSGDRQVLNGPMYMRNFAIVNEPKLASLVSADKSKGGKLNTTYLAIEQAHGRLTKGKNYLTIDNGVIRGPSVGATFQGIIYDSTGNIAMTGTYMPAYSFNRIFGDVPLLGSVLGNGRDKGLIGITFKIEGKFKSPKVVVNPVSAIAPGILRSIFEFKQ